MAPAGISLPPEETRLESKPPKSSTSSAQKWPQAHRRAAAAAVAAEATEHTMRKITDVTNS